MSSLLFVFFTLSVPLSRLVTHTHARARVIFFKAREKKKRESYLRRRRRCRRDGSRAVLTRVFTSSMGFLLLFGCEKNNY